MPLNPFDHEILGFEIVGRVGGIAESDGIGDRFLVTDGETGDVIFGGYGIFEFLQAGFGEKVAEASGSKRIQGADTFSDLINRLEKIFVLFMERLME